MSFVSDELANVLKSVYMMEGSVGKEEDRDSSKKVDKSNGDVSKEKRSRKHKHKKHKSKDKKKHKKRKHKSRSRTRSQSRSRSRSRSIERGESLKKSKNRSRTPSSRSKSPMTPDEIELDFVLEKEKPPDTVDGNCVKPDTTENDLNGADGTVCPSKVASEEETNRQVVCDHESKTSDDKGEKPESVVGNVSAERGAKKEVGCFDTNLTSEKEEKDRSRSRSHSVGKVTDSKNKKSPSHSRSRSKSPDAKSHRCNKNRHSRSHSRDRKNKRNSRSLSSSKESSQKKKSRSRSHSRKRSSKKRSKSRSKERQSKRSLSKSRSRSRSYSSRSRSRSPRRSRSRSVRRRKSRSRSRRKSPAFRNFQRFSPRWKKGVSSFRRRLSRSHSRSRRSRSRRRRSSSRRRQSRSKSRGRRSRSRSRSRLQSRRSRSRSRRSRSTSRDRKRKRSRSKSRSYSRDRRRSRSESRSGSISKDKAQSSNTLPATSVAVTNKVSSLIDKPVASDLSTQQVKVAQRAGGKTIAELTAFCKKLQEEKESVDSDGPDAAAKTEQDDSQPVAHHPFLVKETPDITIPPVIFPVNKPLVPTVDPSKPLQEQFPVSCGSKHRQKEDVSDGAVVADVDGSAIQSQPKEEVFAPPPAEKFDISDLVAKRMDSQRRLQSDPNDIEALLTLQEIQMKMQNWCQSNVKPGQFTGELVKNLLPKENLQGGFQAWAKKDMFHNLTPVSGGIGMKLLQKMGWKPGQVIGKRGEGYAEPIALTVKIDRKGLSTGKEKATKKGAPAMLDLQAVKGISIFAIKPVHKQFNLQCLLIRCY